VPRITEGISSLRVGASDVRAHYRLGRVLGCGTYSQVRECFRRSDGQRFAVKLVDKRCLHRKKQLKDEIAALARVKHPYVVEVEEVFESEDFLEIVMEYAAGGELFDRIASAGVYSERHASEVMEKLVSALDYLHSNYIIHRDIKPENILLIDEDSDINVKMSDFGVAKIFEDSSSTDASPLETDSEMEDSNTVELLRADSDLDEGEKMDVPIRLGGRRLRAYSRCGSDQYTAPEVHHGDGYDEKVDVWSLGVVMYILLCGSPPLSDMEAHIISGSWRPRFREPQWEGISLAARDLVSALLHMDARQRPSAAQILKHPWIKHRGQTTNAVPFSTPFKQSLDQYIRKRRLSDRDCAKLLGLSPPARKPRRPSGPSTDSDSPDAEDIENLSRQNAIIMDRFSSDL